MKRNFLIFLFPALFFGCSQHTPPELAVEFHGLAQIEIGSHFVGLEMHRGAPRLNRISFFYPVANSIDVSQDYWQRENFHVQSLGIKIGDHPTEWLEAEPWVCRWTPFSADFSKADRDKTIVVHYRFCLEKPAFVAEIEITSHVPKNTVFEFFTRQDLTLRTCHSYHLKKPATLRVDSAAATIIAGFDDPETQFAEIFITNAGEFPAQWETDAAQPTAVACYRKNLAPGEKMRIVQITGCGRQPEATRLAADLRENFQSEIRQFEQKMQHEIFSKSQFKTGLAELDHSVNWAQAILAVNRHYIDGTLQPMPCPAEYNFYFTHDVLLTDLAAVNFDSTRVKTDLEFIAQHASPEKIIPHAYYWKDNHFETEFAAPDNWNHFWFIQLAASYLRHSNDRATVEKIFPFVEKSLEQSLQSRREDGLMWAGHPDWWDVGYNFGSRAYMTILMLRSLADFNYLQTRLNSMPEKCREIAQLAQEMRRQLEEKLWDADQNYLVNFLADGTKDSHFYTGSLLAVHFDLLEKSRQRALLAAAEKKLLQPQLGIYNAVPMDFHQLNDIWHFHENEAGAPNFYMNGGIWPHGNAWYALGLIATNQKTRALEFIQKSMTIDGVTHSPGGQPAMYEYRHASSGKIDKPQFMWAAGWYLYTLYHLYGVQENAWNLSLQPFLAAGQTAAEFDWLVAGRLVRVKITGSGEKIREIKFDGKFVASAVIPTDTPPQIIEIRLGVPETPYLAQTGALLEQCEFSARLLKFKLRAFPGHPNTTRIVSRQLPKSIILNGTQALDFSRSETDSLLIEFHWVHPTSQDEIVIHY
jgi:hypothetical protein